MPIPKRGQRKRYNREWSDDQKIAILDEVHQARKFGRRGTIAEILRKHEIGSTAYLVIWKKELLAKGVLPMYLH